LGRTGGSLDFDTFREPASAGALFLLAVAGFGTKAGFVPFHVWLPEAHPAAPSHVSALLSGVMIKTGVYGLLRTLGFLGPPAAWWGWLLAGIGLTSAVFGIVFALAQRDLKRLLAYSSVENIGIIGLAAGLGLLGLAHGRPALATLGFSGTLLHVWHHALMKGLLFLSAGTVLPRRRLPRYRAPGRSSQEDAGDRALFPRGRTCDFRPAAPQRLRGRIPDLPRGFAERFAAGRVGGDRRTGAGRRIGLGLLLQSVRPRLPGRTPDGPYKLRP
jgi:hypothetical protein